MALLTGTGEGAANVRIDKEKCNGCGLCAKVCSGFILHMDNKEVVVTPNEFLGCIACGQCMAICPKDCVYVEGRELSPASMTRLPSAEVKASYNQLYDLLLCRRSIRDYKDKEVEPEIIDKIIDTVSTAPMGIPPSEVQIKIFSSRAKVSEFSNDMITCFKKSEWMFKPPFVWLFRPFMNKSDYNGMVSFVQPMIDILHKKKQEGENMLLYDAPLAMFFYSSGFADPADCIIAATYAMIAAESLGLGSCMIGSIAPFLKRDKYLQKKYGIDMGSQSGLVVIFGYSKYKYSRAIRRQLREVHYF